MNADTALQHAYAEWHRLAETESEAIQRANWSLLSACQKALQQLQPRILALAREAKQEWSREGVNAASRERDFRATVTELVKIAQRNSALLDSIRKAAQVKVNQLAQAGNTLRQVQRSYAPAAPPAWSSFS